RLQPFHLLDARGAHGGGALEQLVGDEAHVDAAGVPAGTDQGSDEAVLGRNLVHMEGLRIVFAREGDDVVLRYGNGAEDPGRAGGEIFEGETRHRTLSREWISDGADGGGSGR